MWKTPPLGDRTNVMRKRETVRELCALVSLPPKKASLFAGPLFSGLLFQSSSSAAQRDGGAKSATAAWSFAPGGKCRLRLHRPSLQRPLPPLSPPPQRPLPPPLCFAPSEQKRRRRSPSPPLPPPQQLMWQLVAMPRLLAPALPPWHPAPWRPDNEIPQRAPMQCRAMLVSPAPPLRSLQGAPWSAPSGPDADFDAFLFVCSNIAFRESLELNLFGLSRRCFKACSMDRIGPDTLCFIAEQNSKRLYGTWRPLGPAAMDIDRVAFAGRQPAQLRVELKRELGWRSGTEKPNGETEAISMRWPGVLRSGPVSAHDAHGYVTALRKHARK